MKLVANYLFLSFLFLLSLFLRTYELQRLMTFIPDQGWFYLSARDMILSKEIPLVGPPTSHPWIHHGAHWTYTLGILLKIFKFDPVAPAYFIALLGSLTSVIFYLVVKKMFNTSVAALSSLLFAVSPLIVMNARIPYHTSPIPFLVILLFYFSYVWVRGKVWVFPVIIFLLAVLYNHEITTFVFAIAVLCLLVYGIFAKKPWVSKLRNRKIIFASLVAFVFPMLPFLIEDIFYSGRQTAGFLVWMIYRIVKAPLAILFPHFSSSGSNPSTLSEFFTYYTQLVFASSQIVSFVIALLSVLFILQLLRYFSVHKQQNKLKVSISVHKFKDSYVLLFLFLIIGSVGLFVHRVPIEADTLLIAPFIIIVTVLVLHWALRKKVLLAAVVVGVISIANVYFLQSTDFFTKNTESNRITYEARLQAVEKIKQIADNNSFRVVGRGELSDFPVFVMPYEYLLWWKGSPVNNSDFQKTIEIWEDGSIVKINELK